LPPTGQPSTVHADEYGGVPPEALANHAHNACGFTRLRPEIETVGPGGDALVTESAAERE
jgi:hypothetical protein